MTTPLRLGALVSGGGRTVLNLADRIADGTLTAEMALVVASRADVAAVERARARGLEVRVADRRDYEDAERLHDTITAWLLERDVQLVCLCGYLHWFRLDEPWHGRAMNIHPALLPDFGGKGMYGLRVHRAVLAAGAKVSGCTVHFLDDQYDHGPIILQRECPVLPGDDEHALADRVFEQECIAYPEAIGLFAAGRLRLEGGQVKILSAPT
ncbi:MAG: phosphoribosylglycinamide formyltransferase [Planctomycetota bacterium]|jgi:formyltetrahydrofolate-dependent phosphoribosylglycinamide formyltransferase